MILLKLCTRFGPGREAERPGRLFSPRGQHGRCQPDGYYIHFPTGIAGGPDRDPPREENTFLRGPNRTCSVSAGFDRAEVLGGEKDRGAGGSGFGAQKTTKIILPSLWRELDLGAVHRSGLAVLGLQRAVVVSRLRRLTPDVDRDDPRLR